MQKIIIISILSFFGIMALMQICQSIAIHIIGAMLG